MKILMIPILLMLILVGTFSLPLLYQNTVAQYVELNLSEIGTNIFYSTTHSRQQTPEQIRWIVRYESSCPQMYCQSLELTMKNLDEQFQNISWIVDEKSTDSLSNQCELLIPEFKSHLAYELEFRKYIVNEPSIVKDSWDYLYIPPPYACVVIYSNYPSTDKYRHFRHIVVTVNPILLWDA